MKKRVAFGLITAMALSTSVAMASPVDMEEGKTMCTLVQYSSVIRK